MSSWDKYAGAAGDWSATAYADSAAYLRRRAELIRDLGPRLEPGETVLDLACGDGGLADFLEGVRYVGVDASPEMAAAAGRHGRDVVVADLNAYEPPEPVQVTAIFRAIYYATDRRALFDRIAGYTEKKLVFDVNPRQYRLADIRADLRAAGFDGFAARPFFMPQTRALPRAALLVLRALERTGPLARLALRARFTYTCSAFRTGVSQRSGS
jgi:SAM-dependent methyltransferase